MLGDGRIEGDAPTDWDVPGVVDGVTEAGADPLGPADVDPLGPADTEALEPGLGDGLGVFVRKPPWPSTRPLSRIAMNTTAVAMTKTRDASSRILTASSDADGAR